LIIAFISSAFFSGTETALISVNRIKLEIWIKRGVKGAERIYGFLGNIEASLITTLVGTNIAVIAASTLMTFYLKKVLSGFWIAAVSSAILLLVGEILPKTFARDRAASILRYTMYPFIFFRWLLFPLTTLIKWLSSALLKSFTAERTKRETILTRTYLGKLVREGSNAGAVNERESSIISKFISYGNKEIRKIMIPRTEVEAVHIDEPIKNVIEVLENSGFSRIPVIKDQVDDIAGIITAKDVILNNPENIEDVLRKAYFVPETSTIIDTFRQMQNNKESIAIVVDEYGGVAGLVTLEDIVEEFFGEINDEYDEDEVLFRNITPNSAEVKAKIDIKDLNDKLNLNLPLGDYQSLGGFLMAKAGRIPRPKEIVSLSTCTATIISGSRKNINWVRIEKKE